MTSTRLSVSQGLSDRCCCMPEQWDHRLLASVQPATWAHGRSGRRVGGAGDVPGAVLSFSLLSELQRQVQDLLDTEDEGVRAIIQTLAQGLERRGFKVNMTTLVRAGQAAERDGQRGRGLHLARAALGSADHALRLREVPKRSSV